MSQSAPALPAFSPPPSGGYGTTRAGVALAAVLDEHLDWLTAWHRLAFIVTIGRATALTGLLPPASFISWYRHAAETLPEEQPVLDRLAVLHDQMHTLARLVLMKTPDGQGLALEDYQAVIGKFQGFIGGVRRLERAFAVAASGLDTLTGLRSRVGMADDVAREFDRFQRTGKPFCLAIVDIDHFKQVNDTYGHDVGDQVLAATADVISRQIRSFDDAYRLGGEEFMLCLKETTLADAQIGLERLREALAGWPIPLVSGQPPLRITASFGLASVAHGASLDALLHAADQALYQAKRGGRNRVVVAPTDQEAV
jgi:diguanylate cyclase